MTSLIVRKRFGSGIYLELLWRFAVANIIKNCPNWGMYQQKQGNQWSGPFVENQNNWLRKVADSQGISGLDLHYTVSHSSLNPLVSVKWNLDVDLNCVS